MKILLETSVSKLGITETDIRCMLKACNKEVLVKEYSPSLEEVEILVAKAVEEEAKKKRVVAKWNDLIKEFKDLVK